MIKISNAILDAVEMTNDYYMNKRPLLKKWAERAFDNIRSPYQYPLAIHVLTVTDGRVAIIPDGVFSILEVVPGDNGTDCWNLFGEMNVDLPYIASQEQWTGVQSLPNNIACTSNDYEVVGNELTFTVVTSYEAITVLTKDKNFDSANELLIPEECLEPISKFIQINIDEIELRNQIRRGAVNYVASNKIKEDKIEYHRLVRRARGRLNSKQDSENNKLMHYFRSLT